MADDALRDLVYWLEQRFGTTVANDITRMEDDTEEIRTRFAPKGTTLLSTGTTGAGSAFDVSSLIPRKHAWEIDVSLSSGTVDVRLQGNIRGGTTSGWYNLDTYGTNTDSLEFVADKPVKYVRAYLADLGAGTTTESPSVTVLWLGTF